MPMFLKHCRIIRKSAFPVFSKRGHDARDLVEELYEEKSKVNTTVAGNRKID
jgi:hypothetical protein